MQRISSKYDLGLQNAHNAFMQLLTEFYKTWRYDRYILKDAFSYDKERVALISYLEKYLIINIEYRKQFSITSNDNRIKKFLGKIIGKICSELYEIVYSRSSAQNIYTYEIRTDSKAYKIFIRKEYNFVDENVVWKEILLFFMNAEEKSPMLNFMKEIKPLNFEKALVKEYINCFKSDLIKTLFIDEVESLYDEMEDIGKRLELLGLLDNPNILWDYEEDEGDLEDNNADIIDE